MPLAAKQIWMLRFIVLGLVACAVLPAVPAAAQTAQSIATLPEPAVMPLPRLPIGDRVAAAVNGDLFVKALWRGDPVIWRLTPGGTARLERRLPADADGFAYDSAGAFYISRPTSHRVYRVESDGSLTPIVGTGGRGYSGDGGRALDATLNFPTGITFGSDGALYIADADNYRVRRVQDGIISTVATTTLSDSFHVAFAANTVAIDRCGAFIDGGGVIYRSTCGRQGQTITRQVPGGVAERIAGSDYGGFKGDGGRALDAWLYLPKELLVHASGVLYFSDHGNGRLRAIDTSGIINTVAGGSDADEGDVAIAPDGTVFIADTLNNVVRRIDPDGSLATVVSLAEPTGVAIDASGNLFVATPDGAWRVAAGGGAARRIGPQLVTLDVQVDSAGNAYVAYPDDRRVRKITPDGTVSVFAGTGFGESSTTRYDQPATSVDLSRPWRLSTKDGLVFIADAGGKVLRVDGSGILTLVGDTAGAAALTVRDFAIESTAQGEETWFVTQSNGNLVHQVRNPATAQVVQGRRYTADVGAVSGFGLDSAGRVWAMEPRRRRIWRVDRAGNQIPVLTSFSGQAVYEDTTGTLTFTVVDETPAAVTIQVSTTPAMSVGMTVAGATRTFSFTPPPNYSGAASFSFTPDDGQAVGAAVTINRSVLEVNDVPTITPVGDLALDVGGTSAALPFQVADVETVASALVVRALSSNVTLIPDSGLTLGGSAGSRTIQVKAAAGQSGSARVTLTVADAVGAVASASFAVTVGGPNEAPRISAVPDQTVPENSATPVIALTLSDDRTPADGLVLTATSSNTSVVPTSSVALGGTGANRTVQITTVRGGIGVADITLTVVDNPGASGSVTFRVTVTAAAPGTPSAVSGVPSGMGARLSWLAPTDGGSPMTYTVDGREPSSGATARAAALADQTTVRIPVGIAGTWRFQIKAANATGESAPSSEITVSVTGAADAPRNLSGTSSASRIALSWLPPFSGEPLLYRVEIGAVAGGTELATLTVPGTQTELTSSAPPGTYFIRVRALDATGAGAASNEIRVTTNAVAAVPGAPEALGAVSTGRDVMLTWRLATTGGAPSGVILVAGSLPGGSDRATVPLGLATSFRASGVAAGTYYLRAYAFNDAGIGPASNEVRLVVSPASAPGAPGTLSVSVASAGVLIGWTAPASGGVPIAYIVEAGSLPGTANLHTINVGLITSLAVPNVANGSYYVRVRAVSAAGVGAPSPEVSFTIAR